MESQQLEARLPYQLWVATPNRLNVTDERQKALLAEEQALDETLSEWRTSFAQRHGREPKMHDIESNKDIFVSFERRKEVSRQIALHNAAPGGCTFYIARRRRLCVARALPGQAVCVRHTEEALAAARVTSEGGRQGSRDGNAVARQRDDGSDDGLADAGKGDRKSRRKTNVSRRMKRMINPHSYVIPAAAPDWAGVLDDPSLPSFLDIGCAKGRFLERMRNEDPGVFGERYNYIGMEIWEPLVTAANERARTLGGPRNLYYVSGNAKISLERLNVPNLRRISILFPDPWDGAKHRDRRLVDPRFARVLAQLLPARGEIYVASDWLEVAMEIQECLVGTGVFVVLGDNQEECRPANAVPAEGRPWLTRPPFGGVLSERDEICYQHWRPVYRTLLRRTEGDPSALSADLGQE